MKPLKLGTLLTQLLLSLVLSATAMASYQFGYELELHEKHLAPRMEELQFEGSKPEVWTLDLLLSEIPINRSSSISKLQAIADWLTPELELKITAENMAALKRLLVMQGEEIPYEILPGNIKAMFIKKRQAKVKPKPSASNELKQIFESHYIDLEETALLEFARKVKKLSSEPETHLQRIFRLAQYFDAWSELQNPLSKNRQASLHTHISSTDKISTEKISFLAQIRWIKVLSSPNYMFYLVGNETHENWMNIKPKENRKYAVEWFKNNNYSNPRFSVNRRAVNYIEDKLQYTSPEKQIAENLEILEATNLDKLRKRYFSEAASSISKEALSALLFRIHPIDDRLGGRHFSIDTIFAIYAHTHNQDFLKTLAQALAEVPNTTIKADLFNEFLLQAKNTGQRRFAAKLIEYIAVHQPKAFGKDFFTYGYEPKWELLPMRSLKIVLSHLIENRKSKMEMLEKLQDYPNEVKRTEIRNIVLNTKYSCRSI